MQLVLKNFKIHRDRQFEFPPYGIVHLSGESGSGKTTILDAIVHCYYGTCRSPHTRGSKGAQVEFNNILRQSAPTRLLLNGQTTAQEQIDAYLGMTEEQFMLSSYIKQDMVNSLISLTPTALLETLDGLANSHEKIDGLLEKIKHMHSDYTTRKNELLSKIQVEEQYTTVPSVPLVTEPRPCEYNIDSIQSELQALEKLESAFKTQQKQYIAACVAHKTASETKQQIETELQHITYSDEEYAQLVVQKQQLECQQAKICQYKDAAEILRIPKQDLTDLYDALRKYKNQLQKTTDILAQSQAQLDLTKKQFTCPHCHTKLRLQNNELYAVEHVDCEELLDLIAQCKHKIKELNENITKLNLNISQQELRVKMIQAYEQKYGEFTGQVEELDELQIAAQYKQVCERCASLSATRKRQLELSNKLKNLVIPEIPTEPVDPNTTQRHNVLLQQISAIHAYENERRAYLSIMNAYQERVKQTEQHKANVAKYKLELEAVIEKLGDIEQLKTAIHLAQLDAIDSVADAINIYAAQYLEKVIPDIQVTIITNKELKNGTTKRAATVHIKRTNDDELWSFSDLSGGEKARIMLSFQLALGDLYNTPILLLDECFRGLDIDNKRLVAEILNEVADKRLILLSEHAIPDNINITETILL